MHLVYHAVSTWHWGRPAAVSGRGAGDFFCACRPLVCHLQAVTTDAVGFGECSLVGEREKWRKNFRLALILLLRCLELVFLLGLLWGFCRNVPPPPPLCSPSYSTRSRSVRLLLYLSTQPPFPIASSFRSSVALPESPLEQGKKCPQASSLHEILSSSPRNMLLHCPNMSPPAPPACLSDLSHLMSHTPGKTF